MKVWLVGVADCESNSIVAVCLTKEIAERELFKERDRLVKEWEKEDINNTKFIKDHCVKEKKAVWVDDMYKHMIRGLRGNDYKKWSNFPHEKPYMHQIKVIDK